MASCRRQSQTICATRRQTERADRRRNRATFKRTSRAQLLERALIGNTRESEIDSDCQRETDVKQTMVYQFLRALFAQMWMQLLIIAVMEVHWRVEYKEGQLEGLTNLPAIWLVLTGIILISMWWVMLCLKNACRSTGGIQMLHEQLKVLMPKPRKPPDKKSSDSVQTRFGRMVHTIWSNVVGKPMSQAQPGIKNPNPIGKRRLLLMGLQMASLIARGQAAAPHIETMGQKSERSRLRRHRKQGFLLTGSVGSEDMLRLQRTLADMPSFMLGETGTFDLIIDTGCSCGATGVEDDFVEGSLKDLDEPVFMKGIAGGIKITQRGIVRYEILVDNGERCK